MVFQLNGKAVISILVLIASAYAVMNLSSTESWVQSSRVGTWDLVAHNSWKTRSGAIYGSSSISWYNDYMKAAGYKFDAWQLRDLYMWGDMSYVSSSIVLSQTITLTLEETSRTDYIKIRWEEQFQGYPPTRYYRISIYYKKYGGYETAVLTSTWLSSTIYTGKILCPTYFQYRSPTQVTLNAYIVKKTGGLTTLLSSKTITLSTHLQPRLRQAIEARFYSGGGFNAYIQGTKTETLYRTP